MGLRLLQARDFSKQIKKHCKGASMNIITLKTQIEVFKKTKEIINFALQLQASIKPEHMLKKILVDEGEAEFIVERDWTNHDEILKDDFAVTAKIATINFAIIVCRESYKKLFGKTLVWATKTDNNDLYAAQHILSGIRHALSHMRTTEGNPDARGVWIFENDKKYKGRFEVKSIGVTLDTTSLEGQPFNWNQIGGLKNFIKVLGYLEENLSYRIQQLSL